MVKFEGNQAKILKEVEKTEKLKKYTDIDKGAFVSGKNQEQHLASIRKVVLQIHPVTWKTIEHNSLYQAAKAIGKPLGFGNIHTAIQKGTPAYNFLWRLK